MKINLILIALTIITLSACGGRQKESGKQQQNNQQTEIAPEQPRAKTAAIHPGKKIYDSTCLVCHMADGSGVPGMFPPIVDSEWVNGDKERLIKIMLQGLSGKIEVNGVTYNNIMPPNSHLSDQEIADVLTYIRQNFENDAGEVTAEEVQNVRSSL